MAKGDDNSFGVASVVLGITAISLSFIVIPSSILGLISLIFGLMQRKNSKNKWSLWGISLAIAAIISSILFVYYYSFIVNQLAQLQSSGQLPSYGQIPTQ